MDQAVTNLECWFGAGVLGKCLKWRVFQVAPVGQMNKNSGSKADTHEQGMKRYEDLVTQLVVVFLVKSYRTFVDIKESSF